MVDAHVVRTIVAAAVLLAQPLPRGGSNGGTAPVSPSVLASEMSVVDANGRGRLELLILWRGSPGWFLKSGGSSRGGSMGGGPTPTIRSEWISQGGVTLTVRFDPAGRRVWIQDTEIALDDANVVLVDGVDSPPGPQVVRALRIDPEHETGPTRPMPVQQFIRRSPELVEFLQCDILPPGLKPYERQVFDMWCSWVKQP